jgi:3',5'-cyclic-AMP phosphodiesterase
LNLTRRNVLSGTIAGLTSAISASSFPSSARRSLKVAYLTDIHLASIPEVAARAAKAIQRANRADLVLFGGDNLMAIDHKTPEEVGEQFRYWERLLAENLKKPYQCILGNHDVEQWAAGDETLYNGKRRAIDLFRMKDRYWSIELSGWRLIGLDTIQKDGERFKGLIDDTQLKWLDQELAKSDAPTLVMGHMPLLSVTALAGSNMKPTDGVLKISNASHVENGSAVAKLFRKHGNVKVALSGHTHMIDRCDFAGTSYLCAGAVCGGWWNGANEGFGPTLFEIDLMSDGSFVSKPVAWEV